MKKYLVLVPMIPLALTIPAFGAEPTTPGSIATMEEVVVTATKTAEARRDVANPMVIIDEVTVAETPAENVGQLLAGEPGIDWRSRGNYGGAAQEIQIRGMDSDETQVLLNGSRINSPSLGRADLGTVPMAAIGGIEVVKGAGSLLYGSGALAGTVNIFTKRPEREAPTAIVRAGYGTDATARLSLEQGLFLTETLGYYLTAGHNETEGERDNSDLDQNDVSLNLLFDKGEIVEASLFGSYVDRSFGVPGIRPPAGTTDHFVGGERFYSVESASTMDQGESTDGSLVAKITSRPDPRFKLSLQADYLYNQSINTARYNADGWTEVAGAGLESIVTNKVAGIEGDLEINPRTDLTVLVGVDYRHLDWESGSLPLDTSGAVQAGAATSASLQTNGTFLEAQYRPIELVKFFAGIRHENHSTFGSENIPRYGLVVNPLPETAIKINHGKFFKAPTPNDLFWPEDDFVRGNPDLSPQTGWHSDATIEQSLLDGRIFATLGYFDWNIDGKITWAENPAFPGPYGNKWTPTNLNSGEGSGWEAGLEMQAPAGFTVGLSYTRTEAREETAPGVWRDAQYMAQDRIKTRLTWHGEQGTTATLVGRYVSEREFYRSTSDTVPTDTLEAYVTADLKIEQRLFEHYLIGIDANNLLDEEYDTYVGSFVDGTGSRLYGAYPGTGRSLYVSLGYEY
ncbi:MAG: TonB-dependent receptor [Proteobacteria bacterium]|nr:TonB-dependent receptor [Pseudomonadota bacterium]MBU1687708.1 TonB-dependent receptor [Pseudomonadota bacterium]